MRRFLLVWLMASSLSATVLAQQADLTLESRITGNQEQPQVLYIVPWKTPGTASDLYVPVQSQVNSLFDHVERAELIREMEYRQQVSPSPSGTP